VEFEPVSKKAIIAELLHELDRRSPAGFAVALHLRFATPAYLFQTYPKRWRELYSAKGLVMHDPTVKWGLGNTGSVRWTELEPMDTRGVLEMAKDHGIMNGITIALSSRHSRSIGSFARADREFDDAETASLSRLLSRLHDETVGAGHLSVEDEEALTDLSVRLTH
jgi:LuxR family transcriptional regulator